MAMLHSLALAALRAAIEIGSVREIERVIRWWRSLRGGVHDDELASIAADLIDQGMPDLAAKLARAEVHRRERARSLYLLGRCLELARGAVHDEALESFRRARARAAQEGDPNLACAAGVRVVQLLAADELTAAQAVAEAMKIDRAALRGAEESLFVDAVLLGSTSRFVRAGALASLTDLARREPAFCERAVILGAQHADARGQALSAVEAERLIALLRCWPDERQREELEARFDAQRRRARELATSDQLGRALVEAAHRMAAQGRRSTAIAYLREARALGGP
ncbi:hypothetical protein [Pendulispora albinea]|uniref:Uncharacterized protein n=1 Tax=Pendulispora albinea TaxID=2741071 RepID=A0ABZ2LU55_9BACT